MASPPPGAKVYTVSVTTTFLSTTFVTVPYSDDGAGIIPTATEEASTTTSSSSSSSTSTSASTSSVTTTTLKTILPPIVTASSPPELPSLTSASSESTSLGSSASNSNTTGNSMIGSDSQPQSQKQAVIGGLSGTIAGLIFIGVIICLILRLRRKKLDQHKEDFVDPESEKEGIRPLFFRTWTGLSIAGSRDQSRQAQHRESTSSVTVDEDHGIIRMNTRHWPRPFAPGAGEGYRDTVPGGQLRVMNPDNNTSRPMTPRTLSDTPSSFLRKQRNALTGFVFGRQQQHELPTITLVNDHSSIAPYATGGTPSFKSYPSITTLPIVRHQTPEDPFISPPPATTAQRRPSVSTLHSTWSHLRHPFRKPNNTTPQNPNVRGTSHFSYSSSENSRRSDPFDLDGPSVRGHSPRMGSEWLRRSQMNPNWILYEGT